MGQLVGRVGPDGTFTPTLASSTIAPKGSTPFQPHVLVDEATEAYRKLMQMEGVRGRALDEQVAEKRTLGGNILQGTMTGIGNAIVKTPQIIGSLASYPRRLLSEGADTPVIKPTIGVEEIGSRLAAAPEDRSYEEATANREIRDAARREIYPVGSALGDIGGDVATLAMGRAPFTSKLRNFEFGTTKSINRGKTLYESLPFKAGTPRFNRIVKQSPGFNAFKRGLGRTGEAGLEGSALALLHGGDPIEAAGFTAGTQGGMSFAGDILTRKYAKLPSRVATFAVNAGIMSGVLYAAGVALPGEIKDYEASKGAVQKMLWGYGIGGLLAAGSARARTGAASVKSLHLTDALASAPRNAMQSVMVNWLQQPEAKRLELREKIQSMYKNIDKFPEKALTDLTAAFNSGNVDRFYKELDRATKGLGE